MSRTPLTARLAGTAVLAVLTAASAAADAGDAAIKRIQPGIFSADETADVGIDLGTSVVEAIGAEHASKFSGRVPKVTVEVRK